MEREKGVEFTNGASTIPAGLEATKESSKTFSVQSNEKGSTPKRTASQRKIENAGEDKQEIQPTEPKVKPKKEIVTVSYLYTDYIETS